MQKYTLKIELLSDTIFSGGESIVSVSDIDVLYDDYKIPFYKGKSKKGNIREVIDIIIDKVIDSLAFGKEVTFDFNFIKGLLN